MLPDLRQSAAAFTCVLPQYSGCRNACPLIMFMPVPCMDLCAVHALVSTGRGLTVELASEGGESIKDWAWGSQAEKYACVHTHTCTSLMHEALHGVLLHGDCEMMACERVD